MNLGMNNADEGVATASQGKKRSRENTMEEKRKMRNSRKKQKRFQSSKSRQIATLKSEADANSLLLEERERKIAHYRTMARSYWERWDRELNERKEAMQKQNQKNDQATVPYLLEIDDSLLHDPIDSQTYLGQGSFAVVKLKLFRGVHVAVKELQPHTLLADVRKEAHTLAQLCHPFLPYLFGVCTATQPYKIIMQFHGIGNSMTSLTLHRAIMTRKITDSYAWFGLSIQFMQALSYLHDNVKILHNDIMSSNILLTDSTTENPKLYIQIILIDFGKATQISNDQKYHLSDSDKAEYATKYPHIAPEVLNGLTARTVASDIYSAGRIMQCILDCKYFNGIPSGKTEMLQEIIAKCQSINYTSRPPAAKILESFQKIMLD